MTVSCANGPTPAAVTASASHGVGALISGPTTFYQLIEEGSNLSDLFVFSTSSSASTAASLNANPAACAKNKVASPAAAKPKIMPQQQPQQQAQTLSHPSPIMSNVSKTNQTSAGIGENKCMQQSSADVSAAKKLKLEDVTCLKETIAKPSEESTISISVKEMDKVAACLPVPAPVVTLPDLSTGTRVLISNQLADVKQKLEPVIDVVKISDAASLSCPSPVVPANIVVPPITPPQQQQLSTCLVALSGSGNGNKKPGKRRGCRCGLATPNPGKLTCCGQRCPCYVDGKGCFDCKCRGCRNPHKANTNSGIPVTPAVKPCPTAGSTPAASPTLTFAPTTPAIPVITTSCLNARSGLSSNAALVNSLQSNGVSCQLVTVSQAHHHQVHQKAYQTIPKTAASAAATITLTSANNSLFLSPSICLINAPAAAAATSLAVCQSDATLNLPMATDDLSDGLQQADNKIPHSMIVDDSSTWSKKS